MKIGIGIDTGGTYTDIVAYDYDSKEVVAKNKTLTTKDDLTVCISKSIDFLPHEMLDNAVSISLSTTLATNACVENKGGRAKLVLLGLPRDVFDTIGASAKYGIPSEDVLCINTGGSYDGTQIDIPDWQQVLDENQKFFESAQSLAFSEVNALRNEAAVEKSAREFFAQRFDVPIVLASDLASQLNFLERGSTALLNARLLPVVSDFVAAVGAVLDQRGLDIPVMILRSDGSLMTKNLSRERPVQTILSGPAASVIGGRGITGCKDSLIVDIGGTTTDISIVENYKPVMTDSIKIGGWRTQVKGVFIDTYGLGGDSRVYTEKERLQLDSRRVVPLCILAAYEPQTLEPLEALVESRRKTVYPMHEFLYLQKEPTSTEGYSDAEKRLLEVVADGPVMLTDPRLDVYSLKTERLEDEGVIMRAGLTPTDVMHVKGDFDRFDSRASQLALEQFANSLYPRVAKDERKAMAAKIGDQIYELAKKKLYQYIMYALMEYRYPNVFRQGMHGQVLKLIDDYWDMRRSGKRSGLMNLDFDIGATLVGIGAPTHVFLPDVADVLGTDFVIPSDAEVANAIGTAIANISAEVLIPVDPQYDSGGIYAYIVRTTDGNKTFDEYEPAVACAREYARRQAIEEARVRGALGELTVSVDIDEHKVDAMYGDSLNLGIKVRGVASGRVGR